MKAWTYRLNGEVKSIRLREPDHETDSLIYGHCPGVTLEQGHYLTQAELDSLLLEMWEIANDYGSIDGPPSHSPKDPQDCLRELKKRHGME
jgi:hypothetical protein